MRKLDVLVTIFFILLALLAVFFYRIIDANGEELLLIWDEPVDQIEGVKIFQKTAREGDVYDFTTPVADVKYPSTQVIIEVPGEDGAVLKYLWVARAYRGELESANSNEINYKVVNIPPLTPVSLSADYDNDVIRLTWDQPNDDHPVNHWLLYFKHSDGSEFIPVGRVNEGNELELTKDISSLAPIGSISELTFTVVAYRRSGVYSANSQEVNLTIDRRQVEPIQNLRIEIEIPI